MLPVIALSQFAGASMGFAVNAVMPDLQQACETTGYFIAISRYLQAMHPANAIFHQPRILSAADRAWRRVGG